MENTKAVRELAGCVLLKDYEYDLESFQVQFHDDWKIEIEEAPNPFNYEFNLGDAHVAILMVPMKKEGAQEACAMNYEWPDAAERVAEHKSHLQVGIFGCENPLRRFILFTMVVTTLMKQENVIGLYRYPTVLRAQDFIDSAEVMAKEDIPANLWVFVGVHRDEDGLWNCYTYGMEEFGKLDMEILHTRAGLLDMYKMMQQIVKWLIMTDRTLEDGQKIGISETETIAVTQSEGYAFDGETLKLAYRTA